MKILEYISKAIIAFSIISGFIFSNPKICIGIFIVGIVMYGIVSICNDTDLPADWVDRVWEDDDL